jgi:hypothetical protein
MDVHCDSFSHLQQPKRCGGCIGGHHRGGESCCDSVGRDDYSEFFSLFLRDD